MNTFRGQSASGVSPRSEPVFLTLEAVATPMRGTARCKAFCAGVGWRLDADFSFDNGFLALQFTPPESQRSVQSRYPYHGGATRNCPRPIAVSHVKARRDTSIGWGAIISAVVQRRAPGARLDSEGTGDRAIDPAPDRKSYQFPATFEVPGGNGWLLQEVTDRPPGRFDPSTTALNAANDLAAALPHADWTCAEHEVRHRRPDSKWSGWYADHMVREQSGQDLPV